MKNTLVCLAFFVGALSAYALVGDYYVSTSGSDANAGTTRDAAFATIAHAVDVAADGDTVCVLAGTYEVSSAISVAKAITIVGDTGNPADVIVRNTVGGLTRTSGGNNAGKHRVFEVSNAGAVLSGLAVEGGQIGGEDSKGGNIVIQDSGGTVTNCIIRNAIICGMGVGNGYPKTGAGGAGIACLSQNGLITHCVITNNFSTRGGTANWPDVIKIGNQGGAAGVHMDKGVLRESLIAYNSTKSDNFGSAVFGCCYYQNAVLIENCTIAGNYAEDDLGCFFPVFFNPSSNGENYNPLIRNTLIVGNVGTSGSKKLFGDPDGSWQGSTTSDKLAKAYRRFVNCATDGELPDGLTMVSSGITLTDDFRPTTGSSIIDAGAAMQSPVALDLAGNPRINGEAVDIGCYEYAAEARRSGVVIVVH